MPSHDLPAFAPARRQAIQTATDQPHHQNFIIVKCASFLSTEPSSPFRATAPSMTNGPETHDSPGLPIFWKPRTRGRRMTCFDVFVPVHVVSEPPLHERRGPVPTARLSCGRR